MEKIVYIVGAGFSAPVGLPVMANFLGKSKDMFAREPDRYRHFQDIFKTIDAMHKCKPYFDADLLNIEEILSILEMREGLQSSSEVRSFVKYIGDVIQYHTPLPTAPPRYVQIAGKWMDSIFGQGLWPCYGAFVASLFNLHFTVSWPQPSQTGVIKFKTVDQPKASYSVVSLNYDTVLEDICAFLNQHHPSEKKIGFSRDFVAAEIADVSVPLAKLHGSADSKEIIAPTGNKSLHRSLVAAWKKAHELLAEANHIRILGYSLPTSDSYIKYLLKSAVVDSNNLKTIDVICRGATVQPRYDEFVHFNFYRFKFANLETYLSSVYQASMDFQHYGHDRTFDKLESVHESFMS